MREEFAAFQAKWQAAAADGQVTMDEIAEVGIAAIDLVAPIYDTLDPTNVAAIEALAADVKQLARDVVEGLPDGRFLAKHTALAGVEIAVPWVIKSAAAAGAKLRPFIQEQVLRRSLAAETLLHHFNVSLGS